MYGAVVEVESRYAVKVTLSNSELECDESPEDEDDRMVMSLARELGRPDVWRMVRVEAHSGEAKGEQVFAPKDAPVVHLPKKLNKKATINATFNVPVSYGRRDTRRVELFDPVEAKVCGSVAGPEAPDLEGDLEVWIGEEKVPIAAAAYKRDRATRRHLVSLSTGPFQCGADLEAADVSIVLALTKSGTSVAALTLAGSRVGDGVGDALEGRAVRSKLKGKGQSVMVSLDGQATVGDLEVRFKGAVKSALCR